MKRLLMVNELIKYFQYTAKYGNKYRTDFRYTTYRPSPLERLRAMPLVFRLLLKPFPDLDREHQKFINVPAYRRK